MENTARKIEISGEITMSEGGNVIDITSNITPDKKETPQKKRIDRYVAEIVSEEEYSKDFHFADALIEMEDINSMILGLYNRNNISAMVLFVVGINTGYRPVDLLAWRWNQITDENGAFMTSFAMFEHKTSKTALVDLNPVVIKTLNWFREYKRKNEKDFSDDGYVFSNMETRGNKTFVWLDKESGTIWHTNKAYKSKGLMFTEDNNEKIVCDEDTILNNSLRYAKIRTAINTDTLSKNFMDCAENANIKGHFSSYTIRQTHSYWFYMTAMGDDEFGDIAKRESIMRLLSSHFNHSTQRVTRNHYTRFETTNIRRVISKMNLGKAAVDLIIKNEYEKTNNFGEQTTLL